MEATFKTFHRVLSFAGISIFAKDNWDSKRWLSLQIFNFFIGVFCFIFTTGFVATNFSDFLLWIQGACIWTTGVIMTITLGVCLVFRKKFRTFLDEMVFRDAMLDMPLVEYLLLVPHESPKLKELREMVVNSQEKLFKYTGLLLKTYVASVFLCVTLYLCGPIYLMVTREDESLRLMDILLCKSFNTTRNSLLLGHLKIKSYETLAPLCTQNAPITDCVLAFCVQKRCGNLQQYLSAYSDGIMDILYIFWRVSAFDMWYPWSLQNMNVYIISLIFNVYSAYLCCIAYPGLQSTIILLLGQVIRQLRILSFILLNINELVLEMTREQDERWQFYCTHLLSQCIQHYVKIKKFSNRLNVICRPFYLALILVAIMLVCVCSVKIAISNKASLDTMKYYLHEFCFILVVLSFCLLGQQVENECEILEKAVTEKWYIFNKTHKKNILIFNMALSQRMPIYIFGTITLSLPTFTWFIRTGMSFFTLVMSVLEEEE